ncbi:WASH complex subunit 3 isoform X2 [Trichoplusia ni]|uniref:WASH complex subunit 3 isoform X2 n=1 Tax=Trichoplusia ni TaxID=7111 RepID=A0A7E5VVN2_TRINI|nr:WASH complex subunit 3 isoform X2 [Trichoplusia ni]
MTLQETMINQELANVDLSKVAALQQKRTLAFVNHFVLTNVQFLNNFMKNCEQKLMEFERKLEKVNAGMVLLEARLSSIPELNIPTPTTEVQKTEAPPSIAPTEPQNTSPVTVDPQPQPEEQAQNVDTVEGKVARPEYDRFVKMVQVGVPLQAVKLKLSLEGLDPNILDEILEL